MDETTQAHSFNEIKKLFSNDEICRNHLFQLRWPAGYECSVCGSNRYDALKKRPLIQCRNCKHQTSLIAGTLMHRTRTPLRYWFWGIYYVAACNGETTVQQLSEKIGLNYHAARRMLGKIHEIEKNQGFMGDLLKSFKIPQWSKEKLSTGPGMETPRQANKRAVSTNRADNSRQKKSGDSRLFSGGDHFGWKPDRSLPRQAAKGRAFGPDQGTGFLPAERAGAGGNTA